MVLTTLPIGMLAQQLFTLTYSHTIAVIIGFGTMCVSMDLRCVESFTLSTISGCLPVCFLAMLGPRFGLRTMVITRYSFGYTGAAVISLLNIMTQVCPRVLPISLDATRALYSSLSTHLLLCRFTVVLTFFTFTKLGFSVLGAILSGQVLHDVNTKLPLAVSVLIIGCVLYIILQNSDFCYFPVFL